MSFLDSLAIAETAVMEVKHYTTDAPMGIFIEAYTPDSSFWKQKEKKFSNPSKKTSILIGKGKNEKNEIQIDPEDQINREKVLLACVISIEGIPKKEIDLGSPAAIKAFLTDDKYHWMLEQLQTFLSDRANYGNTQEND